MTDKPAIGLPDVIRLAKEVGADICVFGLAHNTKFTQAQLEAFYKRAQAEGALMAVKICDVEYAKHRNDPGRNDYYSCADSRAEVCAEIELAIRALAAELTGEKNNG